MSTALALSDVFAHVDGNPNVELTAAQRGDKVVELHEALNKSYASTQKGEIWLSPSREEGRKFDVNFGANQARREVIFENLTKALGADAMAALGDDITALRQMTVGNLNKDWTPTNPVSNGLVPYDLEGPAKVLVPRYTPLRNTIGRVKGQGLSRQFKRITGITNSGQSVATQLPFFASSTQTSTWGGPGNLTLNRPSKISYAGDDKNIPYVELGLSDQVNWKAQFTSLGFDDIRSLSHMALLWAHLMGEERAMLYGRGTLTGFEGSVSAPGSVTSSTATTGGTIAAATYSLYVVALTGTGQSAPSTVATQVTTGAASTITVTVGSEPTGAIYYALYAGTTAGITNATLQTTFTGNTVTITSYSTSGTAGVAADSSASALSYDGLLTVQSNPANGGYFRRLNTTLSTTNPGSEFDTALVAMMVSNGAEPDEIWTTFAIRTAYGQLARVGGASGAASGYRTNIRVGDRDMVLGSQVTGHVNPATGNIVSINGHRFMLPGAILLRSTSLPVVDSHVPAPVQMVNVQDYMAIDWPQIQLTYDVSTYQIGTMVHYAPAWSGLILGCTN